MKYAGKTNPGLWLEDYQFACRAGGADSDYFIIRNLPLFLAERPGNPWDLKNCRQNPGETLREYIRCFSRECNALFNVADIDVIGAFLSGTTCESLVHKLGC
jgi:hypothetical protein